MAFCTHGLHQVTLMDTHGGKKRGRKSSQRRVLKRNRNSVRLYVHGLNTSRVAAFCSACDYSALEWQIPAAWAGIPDKEKNCYKLTFPFDCRNGASVPFRLWNCWYLLVMHVLCDSCYVGRSHRTADSLKEQRTLKQMWCFCNMKLIDSEWMGFWANISKCQLFWLKLLSQIRGSACVRACVCGCVLEVMLHKVWAWNSFHFSHPFLPASSVLWHTLPV